MKKVIVYYSYRGNTKSIAEMIQKSTGADIARIETVVPYDGDYNSVVNQGQDEVNSDAQRAHQIEDETYPHCPQDLP